MHRWGPLIGRGKAFNPDRFFIFCVNALGSPYGSASPLTTNPSTNKPYGPEFARITICDDVRIHKLDLGHLGITSMAVSIGGSMGRMAVLGWPYRSKDNFESRSGRKPQLQPSSFTLPHAAMLIAQDSPKASANEALAVHNEGTPKYKTVEATITFVDIFTPTFPPCPTPSPPPPPPPAP